MMMMKMMTMKGQGPYSKGCGKGSQSALSRSPKEKMMWIGGLGDGSDANLKTELQQFFNEQLGGCTNVEIRRRGQAVAVFDTQENKDQAIAQLNGATFKEFTLQLDVWT